MQLRIIVTIALAAALCCGCAGNRPSGAEVAKPDPIDYMGADITGATPEAFAAWRKISQANEDLTQAAREGRLRRKSASGKDAAWGLSVLAASALVLDVGIGTLAADNRKRILLDDGAQCVSCQIVGKGMLVGSFVGAVLGVALGATGVYEWFSLSGSEAALKQAYLDATVP